MSGQILALVGRQGEPPPATPKAAEKLIGALLQHLRQERGMNQDEVVRSVSGFGSVPKLSRYENATGTLKADHVFALLHFYEAPEDCVREAEMLLQWPHEQTWWSAFADVATPELMSLYALESTSKVVQVYQENYVPGMLQTAGYARALMTDFARAQVDPETRRSYLAAIERRLEVRLRRQHLLDHPTAPMYRAVIAESVLDKELGGVLVMREQLRHLFTVAENKPNVHLRILPRSAMRQGSPLHPAITLCKPHEGTAGRLIYLEDKNVGGQLLTNTAQIETFMASMDHWWRHALSKTETMGRLQYYIDRLADETPQ
ncbi:Scr1 family TA system antitoxin-like transcriptional regulator [Streptomyces sp. NPDC007983]|uniref:Scr1 family TA system antitoxin-like transcriptional regulator n=1 Tax=Streptomyces sp. NPDC007983 TaxID=3364800 RepID=UPI0036E7821D